MQSISSTYARVVNGRSVDDVLYGDAGDDQLYGLRGNDWIDGNGGADQIYGGEGNDNLVSRAGGQFFDGGIGYDFVRYDLAQAGVVVALYNIVLNQGDAAGDTFTSVEGLVGSNYSDFIFGNQYSNQLIGLKGDDWIDGYGGYDTLYGGQGLDNLVSRAGVQMLDGGDGFDFARYDYAATGVKVYLTNLGANTGEAAGDIFVSIEGVVGSQHNDVLYGDRNSNQLTGLAGNDWINGYGGNDSLYGGDGNDTFVLGTGTEIVSGDGGVDLVRYQYDVFGVVVSLGNANDNRGAAAGDVLVGIEGVSGGSYNDYLYGDGKDNQLYGQDGNDWLDGIAGNDALYGGDGVDTLISRAGAQLFVGGNDRDLVSYRYASTGVTASLTSSASNTGEAAGDTYVSIESLEGSVHSDVLSGDRFSNVLIGGQGNDWINGFGGNDSLRGGAGADTFRFSGTSIGQDWIYDFQDGIDKISLSSSLETSFSGLVITKNGTTSVTISGLNGTAGDQIILYLASPLTLDASDFLFV